MTVVEGRVVFENSSRTTLQKCIQEAATARIYLAISLDAHDIFVCSSGRDIDLS